MLTRLQTLLPYVAKAGEAVVSIYSQPFSITWKGKNDPLTEADLAVHRILKEAIAKHFPEDYFLSEEELAEENRLTNQRVWILDPIDGTREFVNKNPEFAISLGLSIAHEAILGIVFNPITGEIVLGAKGLGVHYQNTPLLEINSSQFKKMISERNTESRMLISRAENEKGYFQDEYWKKNFQLKSMGSIAYKMGLVAAGLYDIVLSVKPKSEWDICAGVALINASGGKSITLKNFEEFYFNEPNLTKEGIIAGNSFLIDNLLSKDGEFLKSCYRPRH